MRLATGQFLLEITGPDHKYKLSMDEKEARETIGVLQKLLDEQALTRAAQS